MAVAWRRVLGVTVALMLGGAAIGAVLGALGLAAAALRFALGQPAQPEDSLLDALVLGAALGAFLGAVLVPPTAWALFRRVPLGRAILYPTIGTVAGIAVSIVITPVLLGILPAFGFFAGAVWAYGRHARPLPASAPGTSRGERGDPTR